MSITTPWRAAYEMAPADIKKIVDEAYISAAASLRVSGFKACGLDNAENLVGHIYEYIWRSNPDLRRRMPCPDAVQTR